MVKLCYCYVPLITVLEGGIGVYPPFNPLIHTPWIIYFSRSQDATTVQSFTLLQINFFSLNFQVFGKWSKFWWKVLKQAVLSIFFFSYLLVFFCMKLRTSHTTSDMHAAIWEKRANIQTDWYMHKFSQTDITDRVRKPVWMEKWSSSSENRLILWISS